MEQNLVTSPLSNSERGSSFASNIIPEWGGNFKANDSFIFGHSCDKYIIRTTSSPDTHITSDQNFLSPSCPAKNSKYFAFGKSAN